MKGKVFPTLATLITIVNCVLSYEKYFVTGPDENLKDGQSVEVILRKRKLRLEKVCLKYNDLYRPESGNVTAMMDWPATVDLPTTGAVERFPFYTSPKWLMCSPRHVAYEALNTFSQEARKTFPVPAEKVKKEIKETKQQPEKKKKVPKAMKALKNEVRSIYNKKKKEEKIKYDEAKTTFKGFDKLLLVMHPFLRLAASFRDILKYDGEEKDEVMQKFAKLTSHGAEDDIYKISFKGFVQFVINPWNGEDKEEVLNLRRMFLPTHYDCEVCHPDLYPELIYKVDVDNFEDEFTEFVEDVGLEEVGEGEAAEKFIQTVQVADKKELMKYFAELDESTLKDLADFYRVDLEMFGYYDM